MDTLTKSCSPTIVITANGEVQTQEEATVYVKELDIFLTMKVLENTPAVLSLGKLCDENGYSYEWINGQKPHLIKNGIRIPCNTENFVPIVVPGLSSSSSGSSSTSRTLPRQGSHCSSSSSSSSSYHERLGKQPGPAPVFAHMKVVRLEPQPAGVHKPASPRLHLGAPRIQTGQPLHRRRLCLLPIRLHAPTIENRRPQQQAFMIHFFPSVGQSSHRARKQVSMRTSADADPGNCRLGERSKDWETHQSKTEEHRSHADRQATVNHKTEMSRTHED